MFPSTVRPNPLAACGRTLQEVVGAAPAAAPEAAALLVELAERLLDTYAAALAAAGGRALQAAYAGSRQQLLQALFEEAVRMASTGAP